LFSPRQHNATYDVLQWSAKKFGEHAAARYQALLKQAFRDIAADPECLGSQPRPELAKRVRAYHLRHSRDRTRSLLGIVREPRHFIIYRQRDRIIDIVRVLHDARDLARHLP